MLYNEKKRNAKNIDIVFEPRQFSDPFIGPKPFTVKFYEPTPPTKPMPPTKPHTHATHATHTLTLSTPPTLFSRLCSKLLKYKPRYGLQIKMSWNSNFTSIKLFSLWQRGKNKIPDSKNETKQNWYKFPLASSVIKWGLQEKGRCLKFSCPSILKSLHILFNPSQCISPILLLKGCVRCIFASLFFKSRRGH